MTKVQMTTQKSSTSNNIVAEPTIVVANPKTNTQKQPTEKPKGITGKIVIQISELLEIIEFDNSTKSPEKISDTTFLEVTKFSPRDETKKPFFKLSYKGFRVGHVLPDGDSINFSTISIEKFAIKFMKKENFTDDNGDLVSILWFKEIFYVKNGEHKRSTLVTLPSNMGLRVGGAFMSKLK